MLCVYVASFIQRFSSFQAVKRHAFECFHTCDLDHSARVPAVVAADGTRKPSKIANFTHFWKKCLECSTAFEEALAYVCGLSLARGAPLREGGVLLLALVGERKAAHHLVALLGLLHLTPEPSCYLFIQGEVNKCLPNTQSANALAPTCVYVS